MSSQYSIFYFVRHGETKWNAKGRIMGHKDIELNLIGLGQAQQIASYLRLVHFDYAFSSDLKRARQTAEQILMGRKTMLQTTKDLRERYLGFFSGLIKSEMSQQLTRVYYEKGKCALDPKVETYEELADRLFSFLKRAAYLFPRKTILVTTHSGIMHTLLEELLGVNRRRNIENVSYVVVKSNGYNHQILDFVGIVE